MIRLTPSQRCYLRVLHGAGGVMMQLALTHRVHSVPPEQWLPAEVCRAADRTLGSLESRALIRIRWDEAEDQYRVELTNGGAAVIRRLAFDWRDA